ncbi:hypothetical protein BURK_019710 [Burkholderia sp. SJ98]|nr:hypothetical protein BURK_019710 [Burkholderia sp. SJ98]
MSKQFRNRPPEHAFLANDALRLQRWFDDRVVLTRKTADNHVGTGQSDDFLAGLGIQDGGDVLLEMPVASPPSPVDVACVLHISARVKLIAHGDLERLSVNTFKTKSEAANTCEQLNRVELFL